MQYFKSNITWTVQLVFFKGKRHIIPITSMNKTIVANNERNNLAHIFEDFLYHMIMVFYYVLVDLFCYEPKTLNTYTFMALKRFPHSKRDSKSRVMSSGEDSL